MRSKRSRILEANVKLSIVYLGAIEVSLLKVFVFLQTCIVLHHICTPPKKQPNTA